MTPDSLEIEALAEVLCATRYRSRRSAKRLLHDAGMRHCSGGQLDAVLAMIRDHPHRDDIEAQAEAMQAAAMEAQRTRAMDTVPPEGDLPEWLIGETPHWGRTFVLHFCPGGAYSFAGEIFDDASEAPAGLETHPLDGGQVLSNITWLDGEPPPEKHLRSLMADARRQLRIHDAQEVGGA